MWVTMVGTIVQDAEGTKRFMYGVTRYPELDNPVWFASEADLDVIFDRSNAANDSTVTLGRSPLFPGYRVAIDVDRFFGKHAAVLGNTGSGKSCTVTAVVRAVLDRPGGMPHAHFIIFDTNNEYERAFTNPDGSPLYNRLVLRNDGDAPTGLWVPHWFMNGSDYQAFFRPGEGAQGPLLFKAIALARATATANGALLRVLAALDDACNRVEALLGLTGGQSHYGKDNLRTECQGSIAALDQHASAFATIEESLTGYKADFQAVLGAIPTGPGPISPALNITVRERLSLIRARLMADRAEPEDATALIGVDSPVHFDFDEFVEQVFPDELAREAQRDSRIRTYVGTLQLRLEQARHDPRYAFLFKAQPWKFALASFLRYLSGVAPARHFSEAAPPWRESYTAQYPDPRDLHQVTIIDLSQLASEVLENVTALLGRLILEFMQRCPERGAYPLVLVLEEAHHYIPAHVAHERQQRARDVFERIAKEGRKFGVSLLIASQRPSELSRTVLAQCNSFIVHRIQNPDDHEYFKSVIGGMNKQLLEQLPALAQQEAIVLGDCVRLPLQVMIDTVSPVPHSPDPKFVARWSNPATTPPDFEGIAARWEGSSEVAPSPDGTGHLLGT